MEDNEKYTAPAEPEQSPDEQINESDSELHSILYGGEYSE